MGEKADAEVEACLQLYSGPEMVRLMKECGLKSVKVIGGVDGSRFQRKYSSHPIYIGER